MPINSKLDEVLTNPAVVGIKSTDSDSEKVFILIYKKLLVSQLNFDVNFIVLYTFNIFNCTCMSFY